MSLLSNILHKCVKPQAKFGLLKSCHAASQVWLAIVVFALLTTSCKTVQTQERVIYRDSTVTRVVHDTIRELIHDTTTIEVQQSIQTDEGTTIEFANGGGSYNSRTGEANNVQRVHEQKQTEQNTRLQIDWQHTAELYHATADSLQAELQDLQKENETLKQPTAPTRWHRFLVWYFFLTLLTALALLAWWLLKTFYLRR